MEARYLKEQLENLLGGAEIFLDFLDVQSWKLRFRPGGTLTFMPMYLTNSAEN